MQIIKKGKQTKIDKYQPKYFNLLEQMKIKQTTKH